MVLLDVLDIEGEHQNMANTYKWLDRRYSLQDGTHMASANQCLLLVRCRLGHGQKPGGHTLGMHDGDMGHKQSKACMFCRNETTSPFLFFFFCSLSLSNSIFQLFLLFPPHSHKHSHRTSTRTPQPPSFPHTHLHACSPIRKSAGAPPLQ
jgi:hypothetical protein